MHVFYLHGFASSGRARKAAYFGERFARHGIALRCPDFNEPDFATLTMTRMLDQVAREIDTLNSDPIVLIGSSLGAAVAVHTAARLGARIGPLVLLAPALTFPKDAASVLGAQTVARWRETGMLEVMHHGLGGMRSVSYALYEDGLRYDGLRADVTQPTLIFQGLRDESVDHRTVERYAASRANVTLTLLDDDHQLMASLPRIWDEMATFLGLS